MWGFPVLLLSIFVQYEQPQNAPAQNDPMCPQEEIAKRGRPCFSLAALQQLGMAVEHGKTWKNHKEAEMFPVVSQKLSNILVETS